jgi:hypothetical protein
MRAVYANPKQRHQRKQSIHNPLPEKHVLKHSPVGTTVGSGLTNTSEKGDAEVVYFYKVGSFAWFR